MLGISSNLLRKTILASLIASGLTTAAAARDAAPVSGLGQSWPNAPDVSTSVHYHVYRFERDGIEYIQVNDLRGNVRAAVAITQGVTFALPIGVDAQNVAIIQNTSPTDFTQVLYHDDSLTVTAEPQSDGSVSVVAISGCDDPAHCILNGIVAQ
ncbi:hypothetical protein [Dyella psychrodurans]|uniref:Uncharacterized protein n=1 Tax=Dyella psychrodurans TaxID=1927960 RepID=A0A370WX28_9GAMM|nr:hypothetical protein [Dyella psychrodurans]RDS80703.1 hypothetical protein DWU99_19190 [Dyella psychrodurans]